MTQLSKPVIPITVFTGFLGSGKTTIILSLLNRVNPGYKIAVLKNEFGDVEVDSELVKESNVAVQEMLNGCMCCVLVGQMKLALMELQEKYSPDRIIVETSGSAFPAPIAWQIREMADDGFVLDSIITVVDCVNFTGYEDTSYTAKMQAQYTDLILLNKHELVDDRQLDVVIDHINELNTDTPKVKCEGKTGVPPEVMFGIDTKLFQLDAKNEGQAFDQDHHHNEIDIVQVIRMDDSEDLSGPVLEKKAFESFLASLPKDEIYRVKGLIKLEETKDGKTTKQLYILNHAFGRSSFTAVERDISQDLEKQKILIKMTVMGQGLPIYVKRFKEGFQVTDEHVTTHLKGHH
ncbi:cobW-domain-containing protein [Basidiobolus meristosporus CBS 931.73]|uniref:CobW-domain-containing protein n=1 Tax=Basidiobolus meristosporus CBS 931.73 TaxID=1314790 RepID=A0A1Y1W5U6_9FUNG|nr:cobW-domain-containing protein [Basidiobolus meristosporus CBS 931.73]|eukprot:ORX68887.1 cobW-domain-containing protein [Basidiobolus meristosporus CBS 931.73]